MKGANYVIVSDNKACIVIQDVGPWDHYGTVTNAAEGVVVELYKRGVLSTKGKMLLYYDSSGELDQLLHDGLGKFTGFAPAPNDARKLMKQVGPKQIENQP